LTTWNVISPGKTGLALIHVLQWVAGMGPSLAALFLLLRQEGKPGIKALWRRVINFRLGWWYLPTLLLLPAALVLAHLLNLLLFHAPFPRTGLLAEPWWIPVLFVMFFILQFSEELGWRGYALDRLQQRWSALLSSVILGSIWAIWHLPMFLSSGFGHHDNRLPFGQFFLTLVLMSVLITWLQNNTRSSLVPALVLHAFINMSGEVLPLIAKHDNLPNTHTAWALANGVLIIAVLAVSRYWGLNKMVRGLAVNNDL